MHINRVKLEKRGLVVHEFPFEKHWNDSYLEEKILHVFRDKDLMAFEYVKVNANCQSSLFAVYREAQTRATMMTVCGCGGLLKYAYKMKKYENPLILSMKYENL